MDLYRKASCEHTSFTLMEIWMEEKFSLFSILVNDSNTNSPLKGVSMQGCFFNRHMHFLLPVSGTEASNNTVRPHETYPANREGQSFFVLFFLEKPTLELD